MKNDHSEIDYDLVDFDEHNYPRPDDTDFGDIIDRAMSRRSFLSTGAKFGVSAFVVSYAGLEATKPAAAMSPSMGFESIAANGADTITVPAGYKWSVLGSWGDPLFAKGPSFDHATRGTGESQELALGDNNDGMEFYPIDESNGVITVNHEYVNKKIFSPNGIETEDEVRKGKAGHGVGVFDVSRAKNGNWSIVIDGEHNRRITADTPMEITGPARGHELMKTDADPDGVVALGTFNNCGNGTTPWGTYLACEENFNGYFAASDETHKPSARQERYGIGVKDRGYNWWKFDDRFDISKGANEDNRHGYITEIDPMDPTSTPKKRTALGRFKHENAEVIVADNGHVVAYLGDDERGEFLYRFVSKNKYEEGNDTINRDLLEDGTLYVAKFGEADGDLKGQGKWMELTHGKNGLDDAAGFTSQAEVLIFAREAASLLGATTMDRPEWVAANPTKPEVCCALTNNKNRGKKTNAGGDETPVGGPNPREGNLYGQIVRWIPADGDHTAESFDWDLFVVAGNPTLHKDNLNAGSSNITADNMFNSPDGIRFDPDGRLWIQTDGNYSNEEDFAGMGNNQMLCGDTASGEIRRFLVGPVACEVTGITWTPDRTTMFVGIQHPGEKEKPSNFPGGGDTTPRSSIIVITREDGGVVGA